MFNTMSSFLFVYFQLVINITQVNDQPPVCGLNSTNLVVPVDKRLKTAVHSFTLSCTGL